MGVKHKTDCPGDAPVQLHCTACDTDYWTDETMMNECPDCASHYDWETVE